MFEHTSPMHPTNNRKPYEAPRVLEDLPLEAYSLACEGPGSKADASCDENGGPIST
jgi:hypothetical protein